MLAFALRRATIRFLCHLTLFRFRIALHDSFVNFKNDWYEINLFFICFNIFALRFIFGFLILMKFLFFILLNISMLIYLIFAYKFH